MAETKETKKEKQPLEKRKNAEKNKESKKEIIKAASASSSANKKAKDIGIDVSNPPTEGCNDAKCPYHGNLKVRGRVFEGLVKSDKMQNTLVVEWDYFVPIRKYQRYMRKRSRVNAHKPDCIIAHTNDVVRIAECRPLSKTKSFVVLETVKKMQKV